MLHIVGQKVVVTVFNTGLQSPDKWFLYLEFWDFEGIANELFYIFSGMCLKFVLLIFH